MSANDVQSRISTARLYFETLRKSLTRDWIRNYSIYQDAEHSLELGLALIHPAWLEGGLSDLRDVRGPRTFTATRAMGTCQAEAMWGYDCHEREIEMDHFFPYSLGGPTRPDNVLRLCKEHNRLKGHDIHLLPWATYQFPWLGEQIEAVKIRLETG